MKATVYTASNFGGLNGKVLDVAEYNGTNGGVMVWVERADANGNTIRVKTGFHASEIVQLTDNDGYPIHKQEYEKVQQQKNAARKKQAISQCERNEHTDDVQLYVTPKAYIDNVAIQATDKADLMAKFSNYIDSLDLNFVSADIRIIGVVRGESTLVAE